MSLIDNGDGTLTFRRAKPYQWPKHWFFAEPIVEPGTVLVACCFDGGPESMMPLYVVDDVGRWVNIWNEQWVQAH